jgi:hypothetical protein
VPVCVVEDVAKDLPHAARVPGDPDRAEICCDGVWACGAEPPGFAVYDIVQVNVFLTQPDAPVAGLGECQKVFDKVVHAGGFFGEDVRQLVPGRARRVRGRDLHPGAQGRQGAAEFVARVRNEPALLTVRGLQPFQHLVHGQRQGLDLVMGTRNIDSFVQACAIDVGDLPADPFDLLQGPPDQ